MQLPWPAQIEPQPAISVLRLIQASPLLHLWVLSLA
jgi:hypothetical protein